MAHIIGLGNQSESWKIIILSYKFPKERKTDTVNGQDLVDEAGHLNSMEVECDADAEISETLDEVELDDTCAGASNLEESLDVLTTGGTGRVAAVGCGSGKSALGDGVTESGVGNVGRGRRSVGTVSQKDVNDSIQVAASEHQVERYGGQAYSKQCAKWRST